MKDGRFILMTVLIVIIQAILTKYCQIGPYLYVSLLPALILCAPTTWQAWRVLALAFICGVLTDGLAEGPLGLNAMALVPVAALQKPLIRILIDEDCVERGYSFSFHKNGYLSIGAALSIEVLVFFIIYIIFDSAGERSFGFNVCKLLVCSLSGIITGMIVCGVLNPRQRN